MKYYVLGIYLVYLVVVVLAVVLITVNILSTCKNLEESFRLFEEAKKSRDRKERLYKVLRETAIFYAKNLTDERACLTSKTFTLPIKAFKSPYAQRPAMPVP